MTNKELQSELRAFGLNLTGYQIRGAVTRGAPSDSAVAFSSWWEADTGGTPAAEFDDVALKAERLKLIREQRKKLERENRIGEGDVISREAVRSSVNASVSHLFGALDRVLLSEMPATLCGLEPPQIKTALHDAIERIKGEYRSALERMATAATRIRRKAGRPGGT